MRRPRPERLADETRDLLRAVDDVPALVLGRRTDVLAWNALGHALLAGHLDPLAPQDPARRPNTSRLLFLDPHSRELYGDDWRRKVRAIVGNLRIAVGRHPEDPLLAELIGELTTLRVFVAGRELAGLRTKLTALATTKVDAAAREAELKATLARLDAEVVTASAMLSANLNRMLAGVVTLT